MIGRDEAYRHALGLMDAVKSKRHQLLFIRGGMGVGKSFFIENLIKTFKNDLSVFQIHFFDQIPKPYSFFTEAIRRVLDYNPDISYSVPQSEDVLNLLSDEPPEIAPSEATIKNTIKEILFTASQKKPLILIFEDFHLSDATSIELIPFLFENAPATSLSIVISYRNEQIVHEQNFKKLRSFLSKRSFFTEIELLPFNEADTTYLVESFLQGPVDPKFSKFIYEQSRGTPYFTTELLKAYKSQQLLILSGGCWTAANTGKTPMPQTILDMVELMLDSISTDDRHLIEIASVMGQEFEFELLARLSENEASLTTLINKGFIYEIRPGIGAFNHRLFREAVNKKLLWPKRRTICRKLAEAHNKTGRHPELEAHYWLASGNRDLARKAYVEAAKKYCKVFAYWDAANVAGKALGLWKENEDEEERVQVLLELAKCTQISGDWADSTKVLRKALESPAVLGQPEKKANIYRSLATTQAMQGTWNLYSEYRASAAENFELAGMLNESADDWIDLATTKIYASKIDEAIKYADRAIKNTMISGNEKLRSKTLSIKAYALSMLGQKEESVKTANEAIKIAEFLQDKEVIAYTYRKMAGVFEYHSDYKKSVGLYDSALTFCRREDVKLEVIFCLACMSWVLFKSGDMKRAAKVCREVLNDPLSEWDAIYMVNMVLSLIYAYRGEIKPAKKCMKQSRELMDFGAFPLGNIFFNWAGGLVAEQEHNLAEAYQCYKRIIATWNYIHDAHDSLGGIFSASLFFYENNFKDDLNECQEILSLIAATTGNSEALGCLSFVNGLIALVAGNSLQATGHFERAGSYLQHTSAKLQILPVELYHALALSGVEENDMPLPMIHQVLHDAKNRGLRPFVQKINLYLSDNTEKSGKENTVKTSSLGGLTARQLEVLIKLSEGLTNKEIATQLFLSTRTVDMHVRNIYNHLNCRSRTEALKIAREKALL